MRRIEAVFGASFERKPTFTDIFRLTSFRKIRYKPAIVCKLFPSLGLPQIFRQFIKIISWNYFKLITVIVKNSDDVLKSYISLAVASILQILTQSRVFVWEIGIFFNRIYNRGEHIEQRFTMRVFRLSFREVSMMPKFNFVIAVDSNHGWPHQKQPILRMQYLICSQSSL